MRSSMTLRFSASRSSSSPVPATGSRPPRSPRHDRARGFGHGIDASQHAAGDKQPAGETEHDDDGDRPAAGRQHDVIEPLALVEIAADQQAEPAGQLEHAHQRMMLGCSAASASSSRR